MFNFQISKKIWNTGRTFNHYFNVYWIW